MKDYSAKIKQIEHSAGIKQNVSYIFLHFGYRPLKHYLDRNIPCFRKGNFQGKVMIFESKGKDYTRGIDSTTEEGKNILKEHGYEIINSDN